MSSGLTVDLTGWPGVVLRLSRDGEVMNSNGRLESRLGVDVVGRHIADLLDRDSSLAKWTRIVGGAEPRTWELIFATDDRVLDTGAYSVVRLDSDEGLWLVEHPVTPRLTELASEVANVNTELAMAQRGLVIERARLAHALAELERSNLALDEFAHVVSHDLKAPLRAIREYADLLVDPRESTTASEREADLRRIRDLSMRMRRMIDAALEYARVGRTEDRVEQLDSGAVVRELIEFLAAPAGVTIHVAPDMPRIESERVPFEQVMRNLLSNALTYGRRPDGAPARIDVGARDNGESWEFTVADDGPGIPEAQQNRIWRLFHTTRPGEGTGLGLALVKRIVESRRGKISVVSSPGSGATFHVCWPKRPVALSITSQSSDAGSR
jgi:signal transduction histidine kinase